LHIFIAFFKASLVEALFISFIRAPVRTLFTFLLVCSQLVSLAQERPKIGLVLSGGGARGMAHIGVLKVLEQEGIIPDYITGTSMGSIIGGLYAIGYSADEIDSIASTMDWDRILSNQIDLNEVAFEEKPYYGRYIFDLPVDGFSPGLPKGVIEGQALTAKLSNLTRPAHSINDFSKLPIPFRCIATDIESGEKVVLKEGFLPEAIRASMAIPSIFTPVEIDGKLLVDGGLVRNFPVQDVIDMGADIVIGVFVSDDLLPKEKLNNMVDVLVQSAWVMSTYDTRKQRELCDLYIEPYLDGYGTYSFKFASELIERGYNTTDSLRKDISAIEKTVFSESPAKKIDRRVVSDSIFVGNISVEGNKRLTDKIILGKLRLKPNSKTSIAKMEQRINEVYGGGNFDKIEYDLRQSGDKVDLTLNVVESVPRRLKIGLHYNNEIRAGINLNLTLRNTIINNSRFVADVDIAENTRFDFNFLKYLGERQNLAIVFGFDGLLNDIPFYSEEQKLAILNNRFFKPYMLLKGTYHPNRSAGIYINHEFSALTQDVGGVISFLERVNYQTSRVGAFWQLNTLSSQFFPKKGTFLDLRYEYAFYNESQSIIRDQPDSISDAIQEALDVNPYHGIQLDFRNRTTFLGSITTIAEVQVYYSSENSPGLNNEIGVGGFYRAFRNTTRFWGAELYEFQSANMATLRAGIQWEVIDKVYLTGTANYLSTQYPMQWLNESLDPFLINGKSDVFGGGFGIGYMSRIGPVELNIGKVSNGPRWRTGFNIGFLL